MQCNGNVDISIPKPEKWIEDGLEGSDRLSDELQEKIGEYIDRDKKKGLKQKDISVYRRKAISWLAGEYKSVYDSIHQELEKLVNSENPLIYREMTVENVDDFIEELKKNGRTRYRGNFKGLGTSWSFRKEAAEAVWGEADPCVILITARILNPRSIDFDLTWKLSLVYVAEMELEVKMIEDSRVLVTEIEVVSRLYGEKFEEGECKPKKRIYEELNVIAFT